jgi:PEP-CTERM motif
MTLIGAVRVFALVLALLVTSTAHASLLDGKTVRVTHDFPAMGTFIGGPFLLVVGPGLEFPSIIGIYSLDISDTSLLLTFLLSPSQTFTGGGFNGLHVFDVNNTIPSFLSVTINGASTLALSPTSRVSFDADNIYVNLESVNVGTQTLLLDITAASVPEPSALLLLGAGLIILGGIRARFRSR